MQWSLLLRQAKSPARNSRFNATAPAYQPNTICAPLRPNSRLQCTCTVELLATTRPSLSVGAAFALADLAGSAAEETTEKPSTKTTEVLSDEDDMRFLVRKLRVPMDWLSTGQGVHDELVQTFLSKQEGR
ncbi:predicted protein [Micromonas commoda]|uniref:Uncharacterized protein n=1 Tax=Micromonas commoda (strain RCC299 / NOUM17 / CCMP2709) TaxID=296587 RepID=C1EJP4_MICCC|nr:predicted protein [Micromonas commoda]ACO68262.1 predicted protein [Micromonas commoda]|eukprot:XP_002507004.1 predicted protein [Micromonas commoda]